MVIITIDTTKDSKEDIKKTAEFLNKIADSSYTGQTAQPEISEGAFNMFSNDDISSNKTEETDQDTDNNNDNDEDLDIKPMFYR